MGGKGNKCFNLSFLFPKHIFHILQLMQISTKWLLWYLLYFKPSKQTNKQTDCDADSKGINSASQMFLLEDSQFSICCYAEMDDLIYAQKDFHFIFALKHCINCFVLFNIVASLTLQKLIVLNFLGEKKKNNLVGNYKIVIP